MAEGQNKDYFGTTPISMRMVKKLKIQMDVYLDGTNIHNGMIMASLNLDLENNENFNIKR